MADKSATPEVTPEDPATPPAAPVVPAPSPPLPPKRSPGHRGADVKDTVAEMTAKAHEISLEAGSKMAAAMKDVINAAAGITGFALESARDLVQYMVRRGQMTQEEADKLIRQAEEAQVDRGESASERGGENEGKRPAQPITAHPTTAHAEDGQDGADELIEVDESTVVSSSSEESAEPETTHSVKPATKAASKTAHAEKSAAKSKSAPPEKADRPAAKKGVGAAAAKKGTAKRK